MRVRSPLAAVVATAALLATVAAATEPEVAEPATCCAAADRRPAPPPAVDQAAVLGDSLTVGVTSPSILGGATLQAVLAANAIDVFVSARVGRNISEGISVITANPSTFAAADLVVVGLGTNDIRGSVGSSEAAARRRIDEVNAAVLAANPLARILWIELVFEGVRERTLVFNRALASAAADVAHVHLCLWRDEALRHPEWFAGDGIHMNTTGYRARRDTLLGCIAPLVP